MVFWWGDGSAVPHGTGEHYPWAAAKQTEAAAACPASLPLLMEKQERKSPPAWGTTPAQDPPAAQPSPAQHTTSQRTQHSTAQPSTAWHSPAQHSVAQHSTAYQSPAQHSAAQRAPRIMWSAGTRTFSNSHSACPWGASSKPNTGRGLARKGAARTGGETTRRNIMGGRQAAGRGTPKSVSSWGLGWCLQNSTLRLRGCGREECSMEGRQQYALPATQPEGTCLESTQLQQPASAQPLAHRRTFTPGASMGTSTMLCCAWGGPPGSLLPMKMATAQRGSEAPLVHHFLCGRNLGTAGGDQGAGGLGEGGRGQGGRGP